MSSTRAEILMSNLILCDTETSITATYTNIDIMMIFELEYKLIFVGGRSSVAKTFHARTRTCTLFWDDCDSHLSSEAESTSFVAKREGEIGEATGYDDMNIVINDRESESKNSNSHYGRESERSARD